MNRRFVTTAAASGLVWTALAVATQVFRPLPLEIFWSAMVLVWALAATTIRARPPTYAEALAAGALLRIPGLFAKPPYEDDYFRYLWDGWRFVETGTPYGPAPIAFFRDPSLPLALQRVLDGVNHPDVPTIYAPVAQLAFAAAAAVEPGSLLALKLVLVAAEICLVAELLRLAAPRWRGLLALCPLALFEVSFHAHVDVVGVFLLAAALRLQRDGCLALSGTSFALAVGVKSIALPLAPLLLWRGGSRWLLAFAASLALVYAPFVSGFGLPEQAGLLAFGGRWEFNSSVFALLQWASDPQTARWVVAAGFAVFTLALSWRQRDRPSPRYDWILGLLLLVSPVANPWYLLWWLPAVALHPRAWSFAAMAGVAAAYATGRSLGLDALGPYDHPDWVRPVEGVTILVLAVAGRAYFADASASAEAGAAPSAGAS